LEFLIIWLIFGIVSAWIGAKKGQGGTTFVIGVLLGPLGLLVAVLSKGNRRKCPLCRELMHRDATVCPHCRNEIQPDTDPMQTCSHCGEIYRRLPGRPAICANCGTRELV
jgi:hypothetical protein